MLAAPFLLAGILLHSFADMPFVDDWTYAWSVEHLLKTGELRILDWSENYPFAQILWGTLFTIPGGLSFSALRISTSVLAWLGALAFYASLRELGISSRQALLGTLVLVVSPVFFILTFSFMTDVPFVSFTSIAFFFYVRAIVRESPGYAWAGSLLGTIPLLVRMVGPAVPVAFLAYVILIPRFRRRAFLVPASLAVLAVMAAPPIALALGFTPADLERTEALRYWTSVSPFEYMAGILRLVLHVGLLLTPLALPCLTAAARRRSFWAIAGLLVAAEGLTYAQWGELPLPLEGEATWHLSELGDSHPLLLGTVPGARLPLWFLAPVLVLSLVSAAVMILALRDSIRRRRKTPELLFVLYAACQFALIMALWLFYDRYYLVLLPPLIAILVRGCVPRWRLTAVGLALMILISFSGTFDEARFVNATGEAYSWLRSRGVPVSRIDAGYPLTGWVLYAHPENLAPGESRERDVPWITTEQSRPYVLAVSPLPGHRILHEIRKLPSLWAKENAVYVLEKAP